MLFDGRYSARNTDRKTLANIPRCASFAITGHRISLLVILIRINTSTEAGVHILGGAGRSPRHPDECSVLQTKVLAVLKATERVAGKVLEEKEFTLYSHI